MTLHGAWPSSVTASPRASASRIPATATSPGSTASPRPCPSAEVLNLARRGLLASEVREHQLAPALAFRPDLAIVAAGGNDALRRSLRRGRGRRSSSTSIVGPLAPPAPTS